MVKATNHWRMHKIVFEESKWMLVLRKSTNTQRNKQLTTCVYKSNEWSNIVCIIYEYINI